MAFNYPYGDTQQLNLNWFLSQWETFRAQWATAEEGIDHALDAEIARVEAAMTDLYAARDAAAASKTAAQTAATNAASSETVATQQATLAQSYANTAQTQAGIATAAAEAAGNSASSASTSAAAANLSKTQAANSATAAAASAASIVVDSAMSDSSTNPVQNKVINGELTELKTAITEQSEAIGSVPITWDNGHSIWTNGEIGSVVDYTLHDNTAYRNAVITCQEGDEFYLNGVLGGSNPRLFAFVDSDDKLLEYRAGGSMNVIAPFVLTAPENAAKVIFNDHHSPLNGIIYKGVPPTYTYYANNKVYTNLSNTNASIMGGGSRIGFRQGSSNTGDSGYVSYTYRSDRCATDFENPFPLCNGDVIHCADGFRFVLYRTAVHEEGVINTNYSGWQTSAFTVSDDGLYYLMCEKVPATTITPEEATNAIWIQHKGFRPNSLFTLEKNPYRNVVWDLVRDITSVSHAHCNTQEQFETLQAHYDHLAISNYYPAVPYYPLSNYFTGIGSTLSSPNAEQTRFIGANTHLHMNSLGSFLTAGNTENNNFDGDSYSMVQLTNKMLKQNSGGGVTINHPKWSELSKQTIEDLINHGGVLGIEIWNASCENSSGKGDSTDIWDSILSDRVQCYGFAVPDHEAQYAPLENRQPFGYNHILVINGTEEEILSAYRMGHFYTTLYNDGLTLENLSIASGTVSVEVSESSTITFKTASRTVTTSGTSATFETQDDDIYVRVEASRGTNKLYSNAIFL